MAKNRIRKTYIEGLEQVQKAFEEIGEAAAQILDKATFDGAKIVLDAAKDKAPVKTGELKESLILKKAKVKDKNRRCQYYVTRQKGKAPHFAPVELGTSKMEARPYLRPAFDENTSRVAREINKAILKAAGRIAQ